MADQHNFTLHRPCEGISPAAHTTAAQHCKQCPCPQLNQYLRRSLTFNVRRSSSDAASFLSVSKNLAAGNDACKNRKKSWNQSRLSKKMWSTRWYTRMNRAMPCSYSRSNSALSPWPLSCSALPKGQPSCHRIAPRTQTQGPLGGARDFVRQTTAGGRPFRQLTETSSQTRSKK